MQNDSVALYVRVSTDSQHTDNQLPALQRYVEMKGWRVHKLYCDAGVSGSAAKRPGSRSAISVLRRTTTTV